MEQVIEILERQLEHAQAEAEDARSVLSYHEQKAKEQSRRLETEVRKTEAISRAIYLLRAVKP